MLNGWILVVIIFILVLSIVSLVGTVITSAMSIKRLEKKIYKLSRTVVTAEENTTILLQLIELTGHKVRREELEYSDTGYWYETGDSRNVYRTIVEPKTYDDVRIDTLREEINIIENKRREGRKND